MLPRHPKCYPIKFNNNYPTIKYSFVTCKAATAQRVGASNTNEIQMVYSKNNNRTAPLESSRGNSRGDIGDDGVAALMLLVLSSYIKCTAVNCRRCLTHMP